MNTHWECIERIYKVSMGESAVTVYAGSEGERLAAMLDTGANPCVIDSGTAKRTTPFEKMVPHRQTSIDFVITPSLSLPRRS